MEGVIVNFRRARHHTYHTHLIVKFNGVESREEAKKLIGKKVSWLSPSKKKISGVVKAAHGNKGAVRVIFEKGMPGQSIGTKVELE